MFETIEGYGEDVVALRAVGRVTAEDYREVLEPAIAGATEGGRRARMLLEFGPAFEGYDASAMMADARVGMDDFRSFERIGVVTDNEWIRHAVRLFGPLIPGTVRDFPVADAEAARAWIAE
jgi:hypothetical protein